MPRFILCLGLCAFVFINPSTDLAAEPPELKLAQLIEQALEANPQIRAARQRSLATREQVAQSGALDDPMLGFGILNLPESLDFDSEPMTTKELSLSQKVPFFGKRRLMRETAEFEAAAIQADVDDIANQVIKNVKQIYYDLSHVYRAEEVTRRNKAILEDFSKLTATRYSVGQGIQEDVIRVQVEISRMIDELLMIDQRRVALRARMNSLLNRPINQPLDDPQDYMFVAYDMDIEELQQTAIDNSPMLRGVHQEISGAEKELVLARRDRFPDMNFRAAFGQRDNLPDMFSAMVEINLPVYARSKQNRKVDEAAARLAERQARYEAARNDLFYMIAELAAMARRLELQIELYRTGIIPQTTFQIESAMSAYTVNKADFMTLLDSRMRLYRFELDYHQAEADYAKTIAALEAVLGAPLARRRE